MIFVYEQEDNTVIMTRVGVTLIQQKYTFFKSTK